MKFRFAAVRCFFCQGVFSLSLFCSASLVFFFFSLSLSLSLCVPDDKIYISFFFLLFIDWREKKKKKTGWSVVEVATSNFFIGSYNRIFFFFFFFRRYHCVIDESNRMCVHKTFPVSPQLSNDDRSSIEMTTEKEREKSSNINIDSRWSYQLEIGRVLIRLLVDISKCRKFN